jgi:hypothetical protein
MPDQPILDLRNHPNQPRSTDCDTRQIVLTELRHLRETISDIKATMTGYPALIERQNSTEKRQIDADNRFAESLERVNMSITRVHERMDEVRELVKKDVDKLKDELREFRESHKDEVNKQVNTALNNVVSQVNTLATQVTDIKTSSDSYINKGKGAVAATSTLLGVIQVIVLSVVGWLITEIQTLHDANIKNQQQIEFILNPTSNSIESSKKN